jgi:hypothetical protein
VGVTVHLFGPIVRISEDTVILRQAKRLLSAEISIEKHTHNNIVSNTGDNQDSPPRGGVGGMVRGRLIGIIISISIIMIM